VFEIREGQNSAWAASSCEIPTWTSATASFAVAESFIGRFFLRRLQDLTVVKCYVDAGQPYVIN
jgi:hypothetical protein